MKNFPAKEKWVIRRLFLYTIILGTIGVIFPKTIEWVFVFQLILAIIELIYLFRKPRKPVDMPLELEDYDK